MFPGTPKPRVFQEIVLTELFPEPPNTAALFGAASNNKLETESEEDQQPKKDIHFKLREIIE